MGWPALKRLLGYIDVGVSIGFAIFDDWRRGVIAVPPGTEKIVELCLVWPGRERKETDEPSRTR